MQIHGSITALITPFTEQESVDEKAFETIIERQIQAGTHGLVPSGTTGESPTLDHDQHEQVIRLCIEIVNKRIPVIAGTGSNATHEAISLTQAAQKAGADAALVVVPYYNKPTQDGLYAHFKAIHDATDIPIILYNVPGRTITDIYDDVVAKLAALPRIAGIKDASGDLSRPNYLRDLLGEAANDFIQLSGEDDSVLPFLEAGGKGCISVSSNIAPEWCAEMHNAWEAGDKEKAQDIQYRLMPLHHIMFCEPSPGPVKYAASLLGLCRDTLRLPLLPPSDEHKAEIRRVLEQLELL